MTRNEFIDNVNDFDALMEVCNDWGYELDLYTSGDYDSEVEDDVSNRDCSWDDLRDYLNDLPYGYEYYRRNGWLDYDGMDDDEFQDYKDEVEEWMADNGYFDEEDEEDEDVADDYIEDDEEDDADEGEPVADEDFGVDDLIGMCGVAFFAIRKQEESEAREQDAQFAKLTSLNAAANRMI